MEFLFAYLDAGSGALIIQMIVGGAAGMAAFLRYRWRNLRGGGETRELSPEPVEVKADASDTDAPST